MNLASKLASVFSDKVRARGAEYYRRGRVRITHADEAEVEAIVTGGTEYEVWLWCEDDTRLHLSCECGSYQSGEACKHLWATILAAEVGGFLKLAASKAHLTVVYEGDFFVANEYETMAALEADFERATPRFVPPPLVRRPPEAPPPAPPRPVWLRKLEEVSRGQPASRTGKLHWPADRQVLYVIDVSGTLSGGGIALDVLTRERRRDGAWSQLKALRLMQEELAQVPGAEDRELLSLLAGGHPAYEYYAGWERYHQLPARVQLSPALAQALMPRLARTGRCALRPARREPGLHFVHWDDGGSWRFDLEMVRC